MDIVESPHQVRNVRERCFHHRKRKLQFTTGSASLMAFTRAVGSKSVDHGVRVVAINPPATRTDRMLTLLRGQAEQKFGDPERWPELTKHMPFGRAAEPDEVADLAVFLASDRASYISGVVMTLDGGQAARH